MKTHQDNIIVRLNRSLIPKSKPQTKGSTTTTDCTELSPNAQKIFKKLETYFPPDSRQKPQWLEEGKIFSNGWHDLRKAIDRNKLIEKEKNFLGYCVGLTAKGYKDKKGSLEGFIGEHFSPLMQQYADMLLILEELDFQIETGNLVEQ